jgi:hypothetical protein
MSTNSKSNKPEEIKYDKKTFPTEGNVYINIGQELPGKVTVPSGSCIIFVSRMLAGGKRLVKGPLAPASDFQRIRLPMKHGQASVKLPNQPERTTVVAAFLPKATAGTSGDIELQLAPNNMMCNPYPPKKVRYVID